MTLLTPRFKAAARVPQPVVTIAVYLAGQATVVAVLAWLSHVHGYSLLGRLTSWDGKHFLRIAGFGYTWSTDPETFASPAFLPGYPATIAALHKITGLPLPAAAIAISLASGMAFACAVPHLVRELPRATRRTELTTVAVIASSPMSIVLTMAYSEALFCALAAWALVFALRDRWALASMLGCAAGTVRISGLALATGFAVVAIAIAIRERHLSRAVCALTVKPAAAAGLTAGGTIAWMVYSGLRMGSPTAWFAAQETGWGSHFDMGASTLQFLYRMATTAPNVLEVATAATIVAAAVLVWHSIRQGQPLLLIAYSAAAVAEAVGSAGLMNSKIRLLIPAFMIIAPIAARLSRLPSRTLGLSFAAIVLTGGWFSAYALTIWQYAI